jgi:plasmid stabilization system protein ParE
MTRPVLWTTRAATQLREAAVYLDQERSGTGPSFVDQVEAVLQVASDHPAAFPRVPELPGDEVRRGLVRRCGYWIIYEIRPLDLLVLSVWHGNREPEAWRKA